MSNLKKPTCVNSADLLLIVAETSAQREMAYIPCLPPGTSMRDMSSWGLKTDLPPMTSLLQGMLHNSFRPVLNTSHTYKYHINNIVAGAPPARQCRQAYIYNMHPKTALGELNVCLFMRKPYNQALLQASCFFSRTHIY